MEELNKPQTVVSGATIAAVAGLGLYVNDRLNKLDEKIENVQNVAVGTTAAAPDTAFQQQLMSVIRQFDKRISALSNELETVKLKKTPRTLPPYERLTDPTDSVEDNLDDEINLMS